MEGASIGANCNVGDHCFVESGALVGDNVTIKNGNMLWEGIVLEDGVFVGPAVIFTNDRYPRSPRLAEAADRYDSREWLLPTLVKRGATLGAGSILLPGIVVGEFSMVAAGAVVTETFPPMLWLLATQIEFTAGFVGVASPCVSGVEERPAPAAMGISSKTALASDLLETTICARSGRR